MRRLIVLLCLFCPCLGSASPSEKCKFEAGEDALAVVAAMKSLALRLNDADSVAFIFRDEDAFKKVSEAWKGKQKIVHEIGALDKPEDLLYYYVRLSRCYKVGDRLYLTVHFGHSELSGYEYFVEIKDGTPPKIEMVELVGVS